MGARKFSFILQSIKWKKIQKSVHTVKIPSQSHIHVYLLKSRCIKSFEWLVGQVHLWSSLPHFVFVFSINDAIFLFITVISVHFLNSKIRSKWLLLVFSGDDMFPFHCLPILPKLELFIGLDSWSWPFLNFIQRRARHMNIKKPH